MRNIAEIRKDLSAQVKLIQGMDKKADEAAYDAAVEKAAELTKELEQASKVEAAQQRLADRQLSTLEKEAGRSFSIVKFINELAKDPEGRALTGIEAEVAKMGAEEYGRLGLDRKGVVLPSAALRASAGQNYTTNADGGYAKQEMAPRYIDGLKEKLVVAKLGATILGDLVGTVPVVSAGAVTAQWLAEGASASVSKSTFARVVLTPHRNAVIGAFSKDLLKQTSIDVENIIMDKILTAHAELLEAACISGSGSSNQPTGILTGITNAASGLVATGDNGGAITWANVVKLETVVNSNNANRGKLAYLTNAKVIGAMKTIERASNTARFLLEDGKSNGYDVEWTNLVPSNLTKGNASGVCSAMIFGNWEDLYIGHWGGVDIVIDPYTLAANGDVRFVLNSWDDCVVVEPKSFAAIKDITTA